MAGDGDSGEAQREAGPVNGAAARQLALGEELLTLSSDELAQVLAGLRRLETRDAASVAEQIAALRLAGGVIRLTPTEAELAALRHALADEPHPLSTVLLQLARLCAHPRP